MRNCCFPFKTYFIVFKEQKKCQMGTVKTDFRKTIQSVSLSRNQLSDLFNISDLYKINKK
ncbi:hypothetical protein TE101_20390 (plasmid) [Alteromonas macleodii]|uniref:Uncharacterized protein n=1 Tax=Alteromonas mediterranea TaxID=314275 RepID=A0AAC9F7R9_9ALTE|nr:hypothetical protein AV942_20515 [Alteromonas mediterranea]AMJ84933.1 hypothetical protein AV941_20620 [Alteromonas mediterranea]AUI84735.1 hypothetical protein TE101_20390 [Alteromonas macleodii]CAH1198084.1 hypothetical protein ISS312_02865 [Alteromonas mediterranea]